MKLDPFGKLEFNLRVSHCFNEQASTAMSYMFRIRLVLCKIKTPASCLTGSVYSVKSEVGGDDVELGVAVDNPEMRFRRPA